MADNPIIGHAKCHACGGKVDVKAQKGGVGNAYYMCGNMRPDDQWCNAHARWGGADSRKMKATAAVASRKPEPKPVNDNSANDNLEDKVDDNVRTTERSEDKRTNFLGL